MRVEYFVRLKKRLYSHFYCSQVRFIVVEWCITESKSKLFLLLNLKHVSNLELNSEDC
jgi:hypothetical protein